MIDIRNNLLSVVTTYASAPYVDLALSKLKSFGLACIVVDDGSNNNDLRAVCNKHNVNLIGADRVRRGHYNGDFLSTYQGIEYAANTGYKLCMKVSRRWVPLTDPVPSLQKLYDLSGGYTYSNATRPNVNEGFGFRTDTFVVDVDAYKCVLQDMLERLETGTVGLVEARFHNYTRAIQPTTDKYINYYNSQHVHESRSGYIVWEWLGNNSLQPNSNRMQPEVNTISDYCTEARNI